MTATFACLVCIPGEFTCPDCAPRALPPDLAARMHAAVATSTRCVRCDTWALSTVAHGTGRACADATACHQRRHAGSGCCWLTTWGRAMAAGGTK